MDTLSILLLFYMLIFFGVVFFWRSLRIWQATGINPYRLSAREYGQDNLHGLISRLFRLTLLGVALVVLVYALARPWYGYLAPFAWLQKLPVSATGCFFLSISLVWVLVAQLKMGNSWRIGIDAEHKTELVTGGIFKLSRNPIFLGMRVMLAGLFLVLPNALTLALWWLGDVLMQAQVYLEEDYLVQQHGAEYETYRRQVRRWL